MISYKDMKASNIEVFNATRTVYQVHPLLKKGIEDSRKAQKVWFEGTVERVDSSLRNREGNVVLSDLSTFAAAEQYVKTGKKVAVHNFASATTPGGGLLQGSGAQEERLCRASTLYPCLTDDKMIEQFYRPHRSGLGLAHNDDIIYTPDVYVFKTDSDHPIFRQQKDWFKVDVISCSPPNLRKDPSNNYNKEAEVKPLYLPKKELQQLYYKRTLAMINLAVSQKVDVLILGAFGCEAYGNNAVLLSQVYKKMFVEQSFANYFDTVEFAVYYISSPASYISFCKTFEN